MITGCGGDVVSRTVTLEKSTPVERGDILDRRRCRLARVFARLAMAGFNPSTGDGEFGIDVACGIQAEVSDFHEGARQDVKQESAHEFQGREPTDLLAARAEDDFIVIDVDQALVRDGNPVGVKTKVAKEGVGFAEGCLGVDHPVLIVERILESGESGWLDEISDDFLRALNMPQEPHSGAGSSFSPRK